MPVSHLSAVERIARVLAGQRLSINGDGLEVSAAGEVDRSWPANLDDAIAVLRTLREPDIVMAKAGDPDMWTQMIEAALAELGA